MSAFFWDGGSQVTLLPAYPGGVSAALSINDADQIVGVASDASDVWHAVMWENGVMTDLGPPLKPGLRSAAYGVNDAGQAVGNSGLPPSLSCGSPGGPVIGLPGDPTSIVALPFVVDDIPLVGLSTLSDGDMASAYDINNHGTAVGWNIGTKNPVAVRWSIEFIPTTPEDATEELTLSVSDLESAGILASGTAQSLMGKLDAVTRQLNKGNVTPALKVLEAFINEVEMLHGRGDLTEAEAAELLAAAHQAIDMLNG
jgi:probable HAF family extracellular repeat protein